MIIRSRSGTIKMVRLGNFGAHIAAAREVIWLLVRSSAFTRLDAVIAEPPEGGTPYDGVVKMRPKLHTTGGQIHASAQ